MTILANSDDFHEVFLNERGLAVLEHFVKKNDHFFVYVACKMLAILSRTKENLVRINNLIFRMLGLFIERGFNSKHISMWFYKELHDIERVIKILYSMHDK